MPVIIPFDRLRRRIELVRASVFSGLADADLDRIWGEASPPGIFDHKGESERVFRLAYAAEVRARRAAPLNFVLLEMDFSI